MTAKASFMIVDDSLIAIAKVRAIVEALGHVVVGTAESGARALEVYRECRPDFVTMDITMPDVDGVTATRQIVTEFPDAVVIMVTSHGQERMVMDALKAGALGYVLKPINADRLGDMITKVRTRTG